jgi:hypothetical protein
MQCCYYWFYEIWNYSIGVISSHVMYVSSIVIMYQFKSCKWRQGVTQAHRHTGTHAHKQHGDPISLLNTFLYFTGEWWECGRYEHCWGYWSAKKDSWDNWNHSFEEKWTKSSSFMIAYQEKLCFVSLSHLCSSFLEGTVFLWSLFPF